MAIRPFVLIPPLAFAALAVLFAWGTLREQTDAPSTRVGQPAPGVPAETLPGKTALTDADLRSGEVTIVNFWASWCPPCRAEHPVLVQMAADGLRVAGINIRDNPDDATAYLAEATDPFFAQGFDPSGRVSLDWGVTAPPETFIVAGDGTVLYRHIGPLVGTDYETRFLPALAAATGGGE